MNSEKIKAELLRSPDKRKFGGHGQLQEFMLLIGAAMDSDMDLYNIQLPQKIACSTCRFLTPEFHEKMACWDCITDETLPKWRPK